MRAHAVARHAEVSARLGSIGRLIGDPARRRRWIATVRTLHDAVVGGSLAGHVFHGTDLAQARSIATHGLRRTSACVGTGESLRMGWRWTTGAHFATPAVAAFYAEDLIESLGRQIEPALVAVALEDLAGLGALRADGQSVDCPIASRLGLEGDGAMEEAAETWEASRKDWKASMAYTGSLVCLSRVPAALVHLVATPDDVAALVGRVGAADERKGKASRRAIGTNGVGPQAGMEGRYAP